MVTQRARTLIEVVRQSGRIEKARLVAALFLISKGSPGPGMVESYEFIPFHHGPFSFELDHDLEALGREGYLKIVGDDIAFVDHAKSSGDADIAEVVAGLMDELTGLSNEALKVSIYGIYPEITIFSDDDRRMVYRRDRTGIANIGYEGRSIDGFLKVLIDDRTQILVDVRADPFSRKYGYSSDVLSRLLAKVGIEYLPRRDLSIPSRLRKAARSESGIDGLLSWYSSLLDSNPELVKGIAWLGAERRIALMCYEWDASQCHRGVLSSRIRDLGSTVEEL